MATPTRGSHAVNLTTRSWKNSLATTPSSVGTSTTWNVDTARPCIQIEGLPRPKEPDQLCAPQWLCISMLHTESMCCCLCVMGRASLTGFDLEMMCYQKSVRMSAGESARCESYLDICAPVDIVAGKQFHGCWLACFEICY